MSVDELGRAAASAARRAAATVDPELMLRRLHRRRRSQQIISSIGAAALLTLVVVGVVEAARPGGAPPASPPTPSVSAPNDDRCNNLTIVCVGPDRLRISLPAPVTVTLPATFGDVVRLSETSFESYRTDTDTTGVTVLENAVPVRNDASWSRDPTAGTTAMAMAKWLSKRPFLTGARVTPTAVDGRPAWRVSADLKRGAPLRAIKLQEGAVGPTFTDGHATTMGYNQALLGEYTLLDVPGAGVTVLWSWTLAQPLAQLAGNRPFIEALRW